MARRDRAIRQAVVARAIHAYRLTHGQPGRPLSFNNIGRLWGISERTVRLLLYGKILAPHAHTLQVLQTHLGLTPRQLLRRWGHRVEKE